MDEPKHAGPKLVLLIDADPGTRNMVRPLLVPYELELVQARNSVAGLEILQRMPDRFRLAVVSLEMPGVSGAVLIETLRHFRPGLPVVCLTAAAGTAVAATHSNCLPKPVQPAELSAQLENALAGMGGGTVNGTVVSPEALTRAKASFAVSGNLLDAARELARGLPGEPANGW